MMDEIEVRLPDRKATFSSFSRKKPMAEVDCHIDNGSVRQIVVPARVGKILLENPFSLPREENEAFDLIHKVEQRVCFTVLTEILSRREHSSFEVEQKLKNYGYRDVEIDFCITKAKSLKYINDQRFSLLFIEERKLRGWGRRRIELELYRRGVDLDDLFDDPNTLFDDFDEAQIARALLAKKQIPQKNPYEKLVRFLIGKGYAYSIASQVVKERLKEYESYD